MTHLLVLAAVVSGIVIFGGFVLHRANDRCEEEKRLLKITSTDRDEARQENRVLREEAVSLRQQLLVLQEETKALRTSTAVLKASAED